MYLPMVEWNGVGVFRIIAIIVLPERQNRRDGQNKSTDMNYVFMCSYILYCLKI